MRLTIGVYASADEVVAGIVDTQLPQLGSLDSRVVEVGSGASTTVFDAVAASIGIMRVRALQNELTVGAAAVVCANPSQVDGVRDALRAGMIDDVAVVDQHDPRLDPRFEREVAAAVLALLVPDISGVPVTTDVTGSGHKRLILAAGLILVIAGGAALSLAGLFGNTVHGGTAIDDASAVVKVEKPVGAVAAVVLAPALAPPPVPGPVPMASVFQIPSVFTPGVRFTAPIPAPPVQVAAPIVAPIPPSPAAAPGGQRNTASSSAPTPIAKPPTVIVPAPPITVPKPPTRPPTRPPTDNPQPPATDPPTTDPTTTDPTTEPTVEPNEPSPDVDTGSVVGTQNSDMN